MCGINGFVVLNKALSDSRAEQLKPRLQMMNDILSHRGPDSEGMFIGDQVGLGFRRLSIIDLRNTANQPMFSNDKGVALVFNGEIYNYLEIRKDLKAKGYRFRTESDSEVIINSYLEYGDRCVERFNGMWAFAIYDFRTQRLFCSRDRLGVKPFYYCVNQDTLFFSSELKSLHAVCGLRQANLRKVYEYLAYGYRLNDGETFLENCAELLPGTNLICENGEIRYHEYWTLKEDLCQHTNGLDYHEAFTELFESAVKLRYRSDVPVALLLSGGLDSTSIAKVTDNLIKRGKLAQNTIHAFIASFPDFKDDETALAREFVATCRHIKLHEMLIDSRNIVDSFEDMIYGFDHPLFSFTCVAHNNIMKACKARGIKVVINGQGSDEAFAGYDRYIAGVHLLDQLIAGKGRFRHEFQYLSQLNGYSKRFLLSQMFKAILTPAFASQLRAKYQERSTVTFSKPFAAIGSQGYLSGYQFSLKGNNFTRYLLDKINHQGLNTILHYEDVSSMNQSIEIRSPFLDYRLMEFAFSIPNELKFNKGVTKIIQRETVGRMLPDTISRNRRKIGFNTPFTDYIASDADFRHYVADVLHSKSFQEKRIWKADSVIDMFKNPMQHPQFPFWRFLNLEVWSKVYNIHNL